MMASPLQCKIVFSDYAKAAERAASDQAVVQNRPMKAMLIFTDKVVFDDGKMQQIVIWRVPASVPPTTHGFKYRLFLAPVMIDRSATTMSGARVIIGITGMMNAPMNFKAGKN